VSKPVFEDIFLVSSERRNRKSYFLVVLILFAVDGIYWKAFDLFSSFMEPSDLKSAGTFVLWGLFIPLLLGNVAVTSQRLRDFNWSGWWLASGLLVPILVFLSAVLGSAAISFLAPIFAVLVSLILLFKPGTIGPNNYGMDPRDRQGLKSNGGDPSMRKSKTTERKEPHF
jgi:uncharacterized membrane protein YhaH (DUF805 family)